MIKQIKEWIQYIKTRKENEREIEILSRQHDIERSKISRLKYELEFERCQKDHYLEMLNKKNKKICELRKTIRELKKEKGEKNG